MTCRLNICVSTAALVLNLCGLNFCKNNLDRKLDPTKITV